MLFNTAPDIRTNAAPMAKTSISATLRNAQRLQNTVTHVASAFFVNMGMEGVTPNGIVATDDGFNVEFTNPFTLKTGKLNVPNAWLVEPPFHVEWPEAPVAEVAAPIEVAE